MLYPLFITNKMEHFSFNATCAVQVENGEMRCQLQPKKTKEAVLAFYIAAKDILPALHY